MPITNKWGEKKISCQLFICIMTTTFSMVANTSTPFSNNMTLIPEENKTKRKKTKLRNNVLENKNMNLLILCHQLKPPQASLC